MSKSFVDRAPPEGGTNTTMLSVTADSIRLTPILIPDGSAMIFSVWCQAAAAATITIIGGDTQEEIEVGTAWSRAVVAMENVQDVILTVPASKTVYFYKAQLESGTKVSDWKPAPEDTDQKIDSIKIGGRNIYRGTKYFDGDTWQDWSFQDWTESGESYEGFTVMQRTGAWSGLTQPIAAERGDEYTLSAYIKAGSNAEVLFYCENSNRNGTPVISNIDIDVWARVSMTFTVLEDSEITPRFENRIEDATIAICGLKLEKGNLVTDWSPAPEDTEDGLEDAMSAAHAAQSAVDGVKNDVDAKLASFQFKPDAFYIYPKREDDPSKIDESGYFMRLANGSLGFQKGTEAYPDLKFRPNSWIFGGTLYFRTSDGGIAHRAVTENDYV